ncbi:MAG TPA: ATP-binding cassette domain-containing protein, partial [Marmoricola sp.]|nr:ATP-binding cassette domain-containing protein [Marmoricola sp.]
MTEAVRVSDLVVVRGTTRAVDGVSLQTQPGQITGLLGPSGCGKSTLLRSIVGTQII